MSVKKLRVVGCSSYASVIEHLGEVSYGIPSVNELDHLDMIMFTGGEDVHPCMYNGIHDKVSFCNIHRDVIEHDIFVKAIERRVKITGICRGFQFLNVMCGGEMYQHINNHAGPRHNIYLPKVDMMAEVTSTHHQLVKPNWNIALPVAWSSPARSNVYIGPGCVETVAPGKEIEAAVFPKFNAFGVQFHPEMMRPHEVGRIVYSRIVEAFLNEDMNTFTEMYAGEVKEVENGGEPRVIEAGGRA